MYWTVVEELSYYGVVNLVKRPPGRCLLHLALERGRLRLYTQILILRE